MLLADIDYFTIDHITTTKTKKIPMKKTISIADSYAMAFQTLKTTGVCSFITEFADFDRFRYTAGARPQDSPTGLTTIRGPFASPTLSRSPPEH